MKPFLIYSVIYVLAFGPNPLYAQGDFQEAIDRFIQQPELKFAGVGISIMDMKNKSVVATHQPHLALIPASSMKTLVTASALAILGPNFTYTTEVYIQGQLNQEGTLNGNLVIKGGGDPTLGSDDMEGAVTLAQFESTILKAVQMAGIKKINGYIIGDASIFPSEVQVPSWQWEDLGNYYGAGSWGLNIHDNQYKIQFSRNLEVGQLAQLAGTLPNVHRLSFINGVIQAPSGTGDQAYIYGAPYTIERVLTGTIPVGRTPFSIKGALPNPPLFAADIIKDRLAEAGINTSLGATTMLDLNQAGISPVGPQIVLTRFISPPLKEIVRFANYESNNMYCETLLKTIALSAGATGNEKEGLRIQQTFWEEQGLDFTGTFLKDGSGLSSRNGITADFLTRFLTQAAYNKSFFEHFYNSLPIAGQTGSQKDRMKNTPAMGNLRVKSGTMDKVKGFSGYFSNLSGTQYSFVILVNNYTGSHNNIRDKMEALMVEFCQITR
jgi:D-alanyl-D-alanine carboxypeptidase/D-alanyl-D-alanine-endopeptidase (penicillin-binding protein 4)